MDAFMLALILAAGRGSRMAGLPDGVNKCALPIGGTNPVLHTVRAFHSVGVGRFCVVTGYAAESVEGALRGAPAGAETVFVRNPHFSRHGCNYSLACAAASGALDGAGRLLIAEGDSLLPAGSIGLLAGSEANAVLLRPPSFIDPSRSVAAIGRGGMVRRFAYDPEHRDVFSVAGLARGEEVIGDSMQLWSFGGSALSRLVEALRRYAGGGGGVPLLDSGVHSINGIGAGLTPVFAAAPEEWINLNTAADIERAEACAWLAT